MSGDVPEGHLQIPRFQPSLIVAMVSGTSDRRLQGLVTRSRARAERAGALRSQTVASGGKPNACFLKRRGNDDE